MKKARKKSWTKQISDKLIFLKVKKTSYNIYLQIFIADSSSSSKHQKPESKFDFSPFRRAYRGPTSSSSQHGSPATRSVQSEVSSPLRSFRTTNGLGGAGGEQKGRIFATPPAPRRRYLPSPKANRPSWVQRHLRRPQTVNVDDSTLSGKNSAKVA